MILSVSRRTDIPSYYSEWFFNRIKEGYFYVRNPMNPRQVSKIRITPELVDCIVFWTKNPQPMLSRLRPVLLIAASNAVCRICAKSVPKSLPPMASRRHLSGGAVLSAPRCPAMRRGGCFFRRTPS